MARWTDDPSGLTATVFVRDEGGQVVSEWAYATGGAALDVKRDYVAAGGRTLAQVEYAGTANGAVEYFAVDQLGSTRVVFDNTGAVLDTLDYLPFGQLDTGGATDTTTLSTGQERDIGTASSELDFFHQRYLSPGLLRFVSVDPVKGRTSSSQSYNRYSHVLNNPLKLVDPDGEEERAALLTTGPSLGDLLRSPSVDMVGEYLTTHSALYIFDDDPGKQLDVVYSWGGQRSGSGTLAWYLSGYDPTVNPTMSYGLRLAASEVTSLKVALAAAINPKTTNWQEYHYSPFTDDCSQYCENKILASMDPSLLRVLAAIASGAQDPLRITAQELLFRLWALGILEEGEPLDQKDEDKEKEEKLEHGFHRINDHAGETRK